MRQPIVSAALVSLLTAACNGSNFSGASARQAVLPETKAPGSTGSGAPSTGTDNSIDANANGNPANTIYVPVGGQKSTGLPGACVSQNTAVATCAGNGGSNGVITGVKVGSTTANVGGVPVHVVVYNAGDPPPGFDSANSQAPGGTGTSTDIGPGADGANSGNQPLSSLASILGGLLGVNNAVITSQPNPDTITFGGDKVFHIGDGNMNGSSCLATVSSFSLVGTVYWFNFTVTQPNTSVTITLGTICGVDYSDTNFLIIVPGGTAAGPSWNYSDNQPLTANQTTGQITASNLQPGAYALAVKSTKGTESAGADHNDHDDFIVGNVTVQANLPIEPGQVVATTDDDCVTVVNPSAQNTCGVPNPTTTLGTNTGNGFSFGNGSSGNGSSGNGGGGAGSAP